MSMWDEWWSGEDGYPCSYCGGPHLDKNCDSIQKSGWCAPTQSFELNICSICGGQNGHWDVCPNSYSPPLSPYDASFVVSDVGRFDNTNDMESEVRIRVMLEQLLEDQAQRSKKLTQLEESMREQKESTERMRSQLTEMQMRIESYVDQQSLEDELLVEQEEDFHPFDYSIFIDDNVERVHKSENVKNNTIHELGHIRPHSHHFSTLCIDSKILIELSEPIEKSEEEEQSAYILEFIVPKSEKYIPHLGDKEKNIRHVFGSFTFLPPPHEHERQLEKKLGVKFISSRWRKKLMGRAATLNQALVGRQPNIT